MKATKKRKWIGAWLILGFLFAGLTGPAYALDLGLAPDDFQAEAVILAHADTGKILYEKDPHEPLYPASITKVMTLLLALEALEGEKVNLGDQVVISERAGSMGGSQIFLKAGDQVTFQDLLVGIAVGSGNDASVAVAEHLSGSLEGFVEKMNSRARELGMSNTSFVNACGLHVEGHITTAYDIVLMSRQLLEHPIVYQWFTIWMDEEFLKGKISVEEGIYLSNTNRMVRYYAGCDGIKTGYTSEAGHCIAATAQRDGTRFIAVVLKAPDSNTRFAEASRLLDQGFAHYKTALAAREGEIVGEVVVQKGRDQTSRLVSAGNIGLLLQKGDEPGWEREIQLTRPLVAPLEQGEKLGELVIKEKGVEIARGDLLAGSTVPRATPGVIFSRIIDIWLQFGR